MTDPTTPDGEDAPNGASADAHGREDTDGRELTHGREDTGGREATAEHETTRPEDRSVTVAVTVTRTGGFAGLRRSWHAQPESADAPQWIALIDGCPWEEADPSRRIDPSGADRFLWHVDARCGDAARAAALADPEVRGPWRDLIDAVRSAQPVEPRAKRAR